MSAPADLTRGRPVFVLAIILTTWIGGRVLMWEPAPVAMPVTLAAPSMPAPASASQQVEAPRVDATYRNEPLPPPPSVMKPSPWVSSLPQELAPPRQPTAASGVEARSHGRLSANLIVGHNMLLSRRSHGQSRLLSSAAASDEPPSARPKPAFVPRATQRARKEIRRVSGDAWGLWRDGGSSSVAPGAPSYGRSQMGGVMRYALSTSSPHAPEAYVRASLALDGERERDLALGLSARPAREIPVRVAVEGRVTETERSTALRAGAYVVSEFAPVDLPGEARGEAYLQAGYVTGENGTPFVDGHIRVTRGLAELDDFRLSAGGGVWGGAQEGAQRLDVGPTASVTFPVGEGHARISADYRVRVAGDAAPDSGPALTLATGF